ncbi:energy-coupling factor transport system ATP-binding protein [Thermoactinomyces sp. DSM 45891]|uniref:energy-coupling factor transporter ATPase n=1 Tax=Thermoactinomyces sp. DSM 45891 TaxID=1761907 RepID=UPI00090FE5F1|nr:energy-coupling factor transporter ATPase [Thermoactinomyces sp. DSM 45891]SFX37750.1 energy-coupling factor transport system ATP-binding protein [Thermoactinomyces sp. DSM 45891]
MEISFKDVTYTYSTGTPFEHRALQDIHVQFKQGNYVAVIGKTGSGKSTLVQLLAGLLLPTRGVLQVGNTRIHSHSKKLGEYRKRVGVVFQYPEHQLFEETVAKDIAFGPKNLGCDAVEIEYRVTEAMLWMGLSPDLRERSPFELSGGQMRRVAIAGVLAMRPDILILDEPTAGLDYLGQRDLLSILKRFHQHFGCTVVHVTHNMNEAAELAEQVVLMSDGKVIATGKPIEIFRNLPYLKVSGLDVPDVTKWIMSLNEKLSTPISTEIYELSTLVDELVHRWRRGS